MNEIKKLGSSIAQIYSKSGADAEKYLHEARKLKDLHGAGFAVIYCWFYSVPQKWISVEPKIFELAKKTDLFDMNAVLSKPSSEIARILKPMIFRNRISDQLKNFCAAIKYEYFSWEDFAEALRNDDVFVIFQKLRKHRNIRVTFKNLSAMKIFVGGDDSLFILDRHVARVMGISEKELAGSKVQEARFKKLLKRTGRITDRLGKNFKGGTVSWSLAIWFDKSGISANNLLRNWSHDSKAN